MSVLLAFLEGEPAGDAVAALREWSTTLDHRSWTVDRPQFVDETTDGDRSVGVALFLMPVSTPSGTPNPPAVERSLLDDVRAFVQAASALCASSGLELAFELDGTAVGWIEDGEADELLTVGLIGAWQDRLDAGTG